MRVLLVLEATLGGTSRHILDLADGLLERGVEVHFVYSTRRVDRQFLSGLASLRAIRPTFHCHSIPITREVTLSDILSYVKLSRYVRDHGPFDVIHAHSTKAGFLTRLLLTSGPARMVYTPHGLMTMDPALRGIRRRAVCGLESMLAHRSNVVVSVSDTERRTAVQTGIGASKIVVIPNGIRLIPPELQMNSRKTIRDSMDLPSDSVCIGFVGRLVPQKQPDRVIEAFALLRQRTSRNVHLALIGGGAMESELHKMVLRLGLEESVHFLGEADGAAHMPAFDVLAHASSFEAFGYVFVEALSAGVPIVTTRVGGVEELISTGVTGYVCDPWNPSTFADHLQFLVEDPAQRAAMSIAARDRAAEYTVAKMVDATAELYNRLCASADLPQVVPATYETLPTNSE
jgi:glycosyltransferase involved in cell wall biosynthesis